MDNKNKAFECYRIISVALLVIRVSLQGTPGVNINILFRDCTGL